MIQRAMIIISLLLVAGCTSQPIYNVNNEEVPTLRNGEEASFDQVEKAILSAAHKRGWSPEIIEPGLIKADINVRTHHAEVEISYTADRYSITYKDSSELDYSDGNIHRNYNKWVKLLSGSIQRELGVRTQNY